MKKTISLSTAEAGYYWALETVIEIIYLGNLLENMGFSQAAAASVRIDHTTFWEWADASV